MLITQEEARGDKRVRYDFAVPVRRVAEPGLPIGLAFGRAVRRLRTEAGYSQEQLGARAGLHPIQVVAIERGERGVSLATMERLAGALGVYLSALLLVAERERAP